MNLKDQRTLLISTLAILGITVFTLIGLNFLVEKISNLSPPQLAKMMPPPKGPPPDNRLDDATRPPSFDMPMKGKFPGQDDLLNNRQQQPMFRRPPPNGAYRRMRNNRRPPVLKRDLPERPKQAPSRDDMAPSQQYPSYPPQQGRPNGYYPPQLPQNMDPRQREMIEEELKRRQEMYYGPQGEPPEGYYPPPYFEGPPNGYENGPPNNQYYDYEQDYGYYDDVEGRLDDLDGQDDLVRTAKLIKEKDLQLDEEEYYEMEDDYINEFYDD